jgi:hypothetical protein
LKWRGELRGLATRLDKAVVEAAGSKRFEVRPAAWITKTEVFMLMRYMAANTRRGKRSRRHRHQIVDGLRGAALRALTAARLLERGEYSNRLKAARACGSNLRYVAAMQVLLQAENTALLEHVLAGKVGLLEAANAARRVSELVRAYRSALPADLVAFTHTIGVGKLFDEAIAPAL